ncbi:MAG: DEAD/DEAH box helicase family protein [Acidobacteria bacterium]|nr:DEAD/DEAH box helicase family protein [Acidobacteriota bacterium]
MFQLDALGRHIGQKIKNRGRDYFERNCVSIVYEDADFVSAEVRGTRTYDVDLERENKSLIYSCSCPFFEDNFNICKHIWATLLEMEKQGILQNWKHNFPSELIPAYVDPFNERNDNSEGEDFDDIHPVESADPDNETQIAIASPRNWRRLLEEFSRARETVPEQQPWPTEREILYVFEISGQVPDYGPAIHLHTREPKKTGGYKKEKPLAFTHEMLPLIPDPVDRKILHRLIGVQRETWYRSQYESTARFTPKGHDLKSLLPEISATGRLYFRCPEKGEITPLRWDDAEPWTFRIDVRPDSAAGQYEVIGAFYRTDQRIEISIPEYISREGVLVLGERISFFNGPADWISLFRNEGSFFIPDSETDQWLEEMYAIPTVPRLNLPEELQLEEVKEDPRPVLHLRTQQKPWGASYILGELSFDYRSHIVGEFEKTTCFILSGERLRVLRRPEKENSARQKLDEAGFKRWKDYRSTECWTVAKSRLPQAVRELVAAGWRVEAEGRLYRNPGAFRFHLTSGIDWFELHGSVEYGDTSITIPRLLTALKRKESTVVLDDGSYGMLPEDWLDKYGVLLELGISQEDHVRYGRNQAGLLDALLESEPSAGCDEVFQKVRDELRSFAGVEPADPPSGFQGSLRPYQRTGLGWLHFLQRFGFGGCLADDMGLGKTIQVLALLEERRRLSESEDPVRRPPPSLVVMPRSLVFNWLQEAERFTPRIRILDHTGGERIRSYKHFDDYDAIFTTYGTLRRDAPFFKEKFFDCIILDEAQAIKNASTESAKAARLLKGRFRLALSGTPIENHIGELWSLFEFLNPGMLGSASVFKNGKGPQPKPGNGNRALLAQALRPFILRRTKAQVAPELPEKVEQTLYCRLEPPQRALYDELRTHYQQSLLHRVQNEGIKKSKIYILEALLRLRQAAIHPGLIDRSRAEESSAKMDLVLPQLMEILDEGHKALVFSQFTSVLELLRTQLDRENVGYEYLDGQTRDRAAPVERFQNDPEVRLFLISLKAGGLGLNLTAAEYVFLLDPWWNPAVEAQAIDRTHRIGQTRSVFAYRIIAKDTIEEKVLELQATKREIADAIINQDNSLIRNLSSDDLALLLS